MPVYYYDSSFVLNQGTGGYRNRFRCFFNWKIEEVCTTGRTPVYLYADCLVGIENESTTIPNVQIYPNPTTSELNFTLNKVYESIEIQVLNLNGAIVKQSNFNNKSDFNFSIEGAKGIYFVRLIIDGKDNIMKKIIKN